MPHLNVHGARIEVRRILGEARRSERANPTLVFLHEGLGCASGWRDFPDDLCAQTGCAGLVYSRLGYGRSDPAPLPRPIHFMHEEAQVALPALLTAANIEDAILVGHSDGASIALLYAAMPRQRARALILEAPHVLVEDKCVRAIAAFRAAYPESEARLKLLRRHDDADTMVRAWTDVWLHPDFRRWNIESALPQVRIPTFVLQGSADEYGTFAQVDAVCSGVSGPAEQLRLPDVGHAPHRDARDAVLDAMARYIRTQR